ncbi:MAG: hypothetical protein E7403_01770 [Ruminococcaceae bacterium]|nr:hypothetical protein [Oscillospiraceae bacterium]
MKKRLKSDSALKIFSVIIAICLWFYVVQVQSPDINRKIKGVPVVFTQKNVLEEKNLVLLNDNEYTIDIEIRGSRKYVMDVNSKNLTVLADVSNIEATGRHIVFTNIVLPYANLEVVNKNPSMLPVDVDHLVTVEKPVKAIIEGTPKDSYIVGDITTNPESVVIRGPQTIVAGIDSLAVTVDVNNKSGDIAGVEPLKILGTNNKEIKSQLLTFSTAEIEVRTELLKTKTVHLKPSFDPTMTEIVNQYILDENSIKEIKIAGIQATVDSLTSIQTNPISLSDIEDGEVTVTLDLPQGVRSLDGESFTLRFSKKPPATTQNSSE